MENNQVRVRFAPSPTGPLHIGGVRTALYNYLFARHNNGKLVLRIEDTDQTRFVEGAEEYIIESFNWCNIRFDEGVTQGGPYGPYRQSERKHLYRQYADELIGKGSAYYAFDSAEQLSAIRKEYEAGKKTFVYNTQSRKHLDNSLNITPEETQSRIEKGEPYVIRFKMPESQAVEMDDLIRGTVNVSSEVLDDKILFKSDGMPTYHLANVVDDHLMKISHVIRGEEWLPSLPLHVMLYKAFEWEMPRFAHLPLILKPDGNGKLSKRDGDRLGFPVFPIQWKNPDTGELSSGYREAGYLPESFINMLALLGWNAGNDQELFSMEELITEFSLERVGKSGAKFDPEKAKWFNHQYLQKKSNKELAEKFVPILKNKGIEDVDAGKIEQIIGLVKERAFFIDDLWDQSWFFFKAPSSFDQKAVKKRWKSTSYDQMERLSAFLGDLDDFSAANLETKIKEWIEMNQYGLGQVMNAFRLLIVGALQGPHLFDIVSMLGRKETLARLQYGLKTLGQKQ